MTYLFKPLKLGIAACALVSIGLGITVFLVDEQVLPQSQELPEPEVIQALRQMAFMCLDNPVERLIIRKISIHSVYPSLNVAPKQEPKVATMIKKNLSFAISNKPNTQRGIDYDATFVAYTVFAIPISTVHVLNTGINHFGGCRRQ